MKHPCSGCGAPVAVLRPTRRATCGPCREAKIVRARAARREAKWNFPGTLKVASFDVARKL